VAGGGAQQAVAVETVTPVSVCAFAPLDPKTYVPHELHRSERAWTESNCYIDVWVEVLHALELDPCACLPHVLPIDFEGDQWTFFKPSHDDLSFLYGIDVQELNVWRPLVENTREQLAGGKLVLSEVDAFFLPDTAGTDYRAQHTKTTIGIQELDLEGRTLGYFHNSGYHRLQGQDFEGLFRLGHPPDPTYMPFFAELVRIGRRKRLEPGALEAASIEVLRKHLGRLPQTNPVARFADRFSADLAWMQGQGLPAYHAWAFATLRQLGAAFELGAFYVRWLSGHGEAGLEPSAAAFDAISATAKTLVLKTARAVSTKKPLDAAGALGEAARAWDEGMRPLVERYGARS
jgi:uncharacterized protein DUF1839